MNFLNDLKEEFKEENNYTFTENGAVALSSTMNACLDAFGSLGAMKNEDEARIVETFKNAFEEDKILAMKILFYMRDIRGGQGMRRVFRVITNWLANNHPEYVINNFNNFVEFGRWDDLFTLLYTKVKDEVLTFIKNSLFADIAHWWNNEPISLLAKWLPSENASSADTVAKAKIIREYLGWSPKSYRKTLSKLRAYLDVVEVKMSSNNWGKINYEKVPGKASLNYSNAFSNHDCGRYVEYLMNTKDFNAAALFPVDIMHKIFNLGISPGYGIYKRNPLENVSIKDKILLSKMWESLPNYFDGKTETGLCVVDTSGSMFGSPMEVALSLGIYCADKCRGPFKDHFIIFSHKPELIELKGNDILEKVSHIPCINSCNTDLEKVFDIILRTAVNNNVKPEDLPSKLYIISDMQFDAARGASNIISGWDRPNQTFMASMKQKYENAGYSLPNIVYWDVRGSKCGMFQQKFDGEDCAMVSGYSPSLFKSIIEGTTYEQIVNEDGEVTVKEKLDPMTVMMNTLNNPRYEVVWVG